MRPSSVMNDYEGPLKMLQPKTYTSLLTLGAKDGSSPIGMNSDCWSNNNNNQKMQVRCHYFLSKFIHVCYLALKVIYCIHKCSLVLPFASFCGSAVAARASFSQKVSDGQGSAAVTLLSKAVLRITAFMQWYFYKVDESILMFIRDQFYPSLPLCY